MALDVFKWCTQLQEGGGGNSVANSVVGVQFGNGYRQVVGAGYNTARNTFSIVYAGPNPEFADVKAFIMSHITTPFAWKMPDGSMNVFIVMADSVKISVLGKSTFELKCDFEQQFTAI